jgi:hypothetical protein
MTLSVTTGDCDGVTVLFALDDLRIHLTTLDSSPFYFLGGAREAGTVGRKKGLVGGAWGYW